jgi:hypothetical protein
MRMRSPAAWSDRATPARSLRSLCVGGRGSSTVDVAASAALVGLGPELPFKLHKAPDPGAICTDVRLNVGSQLADGGQVDAEQLGALVERCRNRPAQVRVVPGPHRNRLSNTGSRVDQQRCVVRGWGAYSVCGPRWGRNSVEPGGQQRTAGDNKRRGQRPLRSHSPRQRNPWSALSHGNGHSTWSR